MSCVLIRGSDMSTKEELVKLRDVLCDCLESSILEPREHFELESRRTVAYHVCEPVRLAIVQTNRAILGYAAVPAVKSLEEL